MSDLLETIKVIFPRQLIGQLAARLGEGERGVSRALEGAIPALLGGLIAKVAAGDGQWVFAWNQRAYRTTQDKLTSVTGLLVIFGSGNTLGSAMAEGEMLLATLFGAAGQAVADSVSRYARIKPASTRTLLAMAGAVLPAALGKYALRHQLAASAVAGALLSEKGRVRAMLPHGLEGIAELLGFGGRRQWLAKASGARDVVRPPAAPSGATIRSSWYMAIFVAVVIASVGAGIIVLNPRLQAHTPQRPPTGPAAARHGHGMETITRMAGGSVSPLRTDY